MKSAHIAVIGVLAMAVMTPSANAQNSTYTLVQTAKPIPASYPGVNANILGLRIGMTVSQAETIAAKTFPGSKSQEFKSAVSINYPGGLASSQSYVSRVDLRSGPFDSLRLYFTNPATGNVLYGMTASIDYPDVSKAPLMTALGARLVKEYGPGSEGSYTWNFGKRSLDKCLLVGCQPVNIGTGPFYNPGVVLEIYASLSPSKMDGAKVGSITMGMQDYQLQTESVNAADKQIKALATAYYDKMVLAKSEAEQKLRNNASNVLDVTGAVTGHALVTTCIGGLGAETFSSADAAEMRLSISKYLSEAMFQKYGIGPVTYAGKKYNMVVAAFGKPPGTTNADVELNPVKGQGTTGSWGNTLVEGSITIADSGLSRAVTFDHAVLKPVPHQRNPPSGPVTINGKAYCEGPGEPLPPELFVPAQVLTGNYTGPYVLPNGKKTTVWLEFVSGTAVTVQFAHEDPQTTHKDTYKFNGDLLLVQPPNDGDMRGLGLKLDSSGCFDTMQNSKLCKTAAPMPAAMKAMEIKQEQEKAAAIAANAKRANALKLMPKF